MNDTVLYFTFLHKFERPIRTLATICYPLVLVLRNTKYIIQLIIIIATVGIVR